MTTAEEILEKSWRLIKLTSEDLLEGTKKLVEVGLIDEEHREPIRRIQEKAAINYELCLYKKKPKDI